MPTGNKIAISVMAISVFVSGGNPGAPGLRPAESSDRRAPESLDSAIRFARERCARMGTIVDYIATFEKTELVEGKVIEQSMHMKLRRKPFSVYLCYRSGKGKGREVLYVEGANDNQLLVQEPGFLASVVGTVEVNIEDPRVRAENRYLITEIGMRGILDRSLANWKSEQSADADNVEARFLPDCKFELMDCEAIELVRRQRGPKFPYSLTRVYFDRRSKLATGAEQYGWPASKGEKDPLLERYVYSDVETNVGLTDADFDPENPAYSFKFAAK